MLEIIYEDEDLIAINKEAGLLVHRTKIDKYETRFAVQELRDQIGKKVFPVHRLDKPTSGVLLFALNADMAAKISKIFEANKVTKEYLAVVRGYTEELGQIDYALKEQLDKMTDNLADQNKPAQQAKTNYRRLTTLELPIPVGRYDTSRYSLLAVEPLTGRKHQIRRHMKHIFHPLVGDTTHGDGKHNTMFRSRFNCHRLLLHAKSLSFIHPESNRPVKIEAGVDESFSRILALFD